ncbi:MAG: AAA-associated domain-containing protein [Desulfurococcaceae archaeon]|nr:AAA-associated domain-containing protein [Desulfurococcaceae archaeon]
MSSEKYDILIPPDVTPDHVLGFLETLYSLGGRLDPMYIGDAIGENIRILPHAIDLAEALNLVVYKEGVISITDFGKEVAKADVKSVRRMLRRFAFKLQPLKDIVEKLKRKGFLEIEEYEELISSRYPANFREAFKNILIWGTFLRLFKMNERDDMIIPIDLSGL